MGQYVVGTPIGTCRYAMTGAESSPMVGRVSAICSDSDIWAAQCPVMAGYCPCKAAPSPRVQCFYLSWLAFAPSSLQSDCRCTKTSITWTKLAKSGICHGAKSQLTKCHLSRTCFCHLQAVERASHFSSCIIPNFIPGPGPNLIPPGYRCASWAAPADQIQPSPPV